jgi:hypothetical protein
MHQRYSDDRRQPYRQPCGFAFEYPQIRATNSPWISRWNRSPESPLGRPSSRPMGRSIDCLAHLLSKTRRRAESPTAARCCLALRCTLPASKAIPRDSHCRRPQPGWIRRGDRGAPTAWHVPLSLAAAPGEPRRAHSPCRTDWAASSGFAPRQDAGAFQTTDGLGDGAERAAGAGCRRQG